MARKHVFVVVLEKRVRRHGGVFGTTEDEFEAESASEAESIAITAWREVDSRYTYHPLLTRLKEDN